VQEEFARRSRLRDLPDCINWSKVENEYVGKGKEENSIKWEVMFKSTAQLTQTNCCFLGGVFLFSSLFFIAFLSEFFVLFHYLFWVWTSCIWLCARVWLSMLHSSIQPNATNPNPRSNNYCLKVKPWCWKIFNALDPIKTTSWKTLRNNDIPLFFRA
jgi:hypothetical protein